MNEFIFGLIDDRQFNPDYVNWQDNLSQRAISLTSIVKKDHYTSVDILPWQDCAAKFLFKDKLYNRQGKIIDAEYKNETVIVPFIYGWDNYTELALACIKDNLSFLQKDNVIVVIINPYEADDEYPNDCEKIQNLIGKQLYVISPDAALTFKNDKIKSFYHNVFIDFAIDENYKVEYSPKKLYINLTRTIRPHRIKLIEELIKNKLFPLGYNTWLNRKIRRPPQIPRIVAKAKFDSFAEDPYLLKRFNPYQYCNESFLSLITETDINPNKLFITEKTWRPIIIQHPFIVLGNPGTLDYLKTKGYLTFSAWLDESYDFNLPYNKRIDIVIRELKKLAKLPSKQLVNIRQDMESVCEYNYNLYKIHVNRHNLLDIMYSIKNYHDFNK